MQSNLGASEPTQGHIEVDIGKLGKTQNSTIQERDLNKHQTPLSSSS